MKNALAVSEHVFLTLSDIEFLAIRSQGAGGQNVNKVSSAIHLRFDIINANLPESYKQRLLSMNDKRISKEGVIVIKSQEHRTQEKNRAVAIERLVLMIQQACKSTKKRIATKPTRGSKVRRVDSKTRRGRTKSLRSKVSW